jgi:hypothetical protein
MGSGATESDGLPSTGVEIDGGHYCCETSSDLNNLVHVLELCSQSLVRRGIEIQVAPGLMSRSEYILLEFIIK